MLKSRTKIGIAKVFAKVRSGYIGTQIREGGVIDPTLAQFPPRYKKTAFKKEPSLKPARFM